MHNITNEQFNNCITAFNEVLVENLIFDKEYTLTIKNNYIKKVNFDKSYLFTSIEMSKKIDSEVIRIDFTVSYHDFYQVPILNIRPYKDGSFTALNGIGLQIAPTVITALTTHHILQKTWIEVHACETLEALQTLPEIYGTTVDSVLEYLCCWFGFYGLPAIFPNIRFRPHLYM
ncbi:uncharacterized protein SPAPADRAFT_139973 [Spathaspora passalidarum NRRL Y-27907]|uniref:Uncharacterized protein n=1 Tax=Spathaspora passalidarum (strain NRRL Y-27907 / 11-Y1) TaxID=619300 RepID=G3AQH3_SPAPN|nr:uncharacterized protein SPAPADRAFT_139973 [Spathaspora passalidarum NRRL Y-27907]EGW31520.1 hypothetical protein SPAPADRAFT_139973 [Spathaspora passalidarum NRRL Y-27907]